MKDSPTVLVIEDEAHIRVALEYNLKMDGFEVFTAENGAKGLEKASSIVPDLILCDWMMPEMNGLEVVSRLKQDPATKDIPVFMLTAKGMSGDLEQAIAMGANDYLTKPFDPMKLGSVLREKLAAIVGG